MLILELGHVDPFFTHRYDAAGKEGIGPVVRILLCLKVLAFGVLPTAFLDYFQMGETTTRDCLKHLCVALMSSVNIKSIFFCKMTRADARRLSNLHEEHHYIP